MKSRPAFWDTSALVPLCCHQAVSAKARQAARVHRPFVVWWGAYVESFNTFTRLHREGDLTLAQFDQMRRKLQIMRKGWVEIAPTEQILDVAEKVLLQHSLTSADGLQLSAAMIWCNEKPRNHSFVCADKKLSEAAEKTGFDLVFLS